MIEVQKTVDVIIPVYNAVNELKACVNSILNHTKYKNYRIVIINDCSPDQKVNQYLETIQSEEKVVILQNKTNLGFVGTVNKGMSYSENDVILLNSDTVVTDRWLQKLITVAYLDQSTATVTPLTNNGTICSVPNFIEDNEIPKGYTIDSFAELIEKISLEKFPEAPTAVGFCMFIKREVIKKIGLFDQETFGKGYAEENDFCCRVIEHGYKNIIADNTFIYHKGSMSFQGDKLDLLKKNLKTLNNRYPYYEKNVHQFITTNPLRDIHENIKIQMNHYKKQDDSKGNILFVLHNFFDEKYNHPIGGTEYHVKDIVTNLKDYNSFVMVTNQSEIIVKKYQDGELVGRYRFKLDQPITTTHFTHRQYKEIAEKIISTLDISLIHIHHLRTHTFDIPYIAKKYGVKVLYTLHDFHFFCPKVNLLDENNQYCIDIRGEMKCKQCLWKDHHFHTPFINIWREQIEKVMQNVDLFICPSKSTENMFRAEFKSFFNHENIITIEHGITNYDSFSKSKKVVNKPLRIGFLGGLSPTKGSDLIFKVMTKYPKNNVEWHLIGELGDQKLNLLNQSNVIKHGAYQRESLSKLLDEMNLDLICLFSPWPETYSYTLTEAWIQGIPVLVVPMGALKERVENVGGGWVTKDIKLQSIVESLDEIMNLQQEEWDYVLTKIQAYNFKSKDEMVNEYVELYDKHRLIVSEGNQRANCFSNVEVLNSIKYFIPGSGNISNEEYNNKLNELQNEIDLMKSTIGWKVLRVLRERSPNILKVGKKAIFTVLKMKSVK
jgi:GT2 family glycosyltransferase/glycosyltransferase involved in cell wall biosynthesis